MASGLGLRVGELAPPAALDWCSVLMVTPSCGEEEEEELPEEPDPEEPCCCWWIVDVVVATVPGTGMVIPGHPGTEQHTGFGDGVLAKGDNGMWPTDFLRGVWSDF
jgi:hypothetical protein